MASVGGGQGLPCVRHSHFQLPLQGTPCSWAHQPSWWHLWKNMFKKRQKILRRGETQRELGNGLEEGRREGMIRSEDKEVLCGRAGTSLKSLWPTDYIMAERVHLRRDWGPQRTHDGAKDQSEKGAALERNCWVLTLTSCTAGCLTKGLALASHQQLVLIHPPVPPSFRTQTSHSCLASSEVPLWSKENESKQ